MNSPERRAHWRNENHDGESTAGRQGLLIGLAASLVGGVIFALQDPLLALSLRAGLTAICLVAAVLFGLAYWNARAFSPQWGVLGTAWGGCALVTLLAVLGGHGIQSRGLGFFAPLVVLVAVLARPGHALALAAACAAVLGGIIVAEAAGWLHGAAVVAKAPLSTPAIAQVLLLATGLGIGLTVARFAETGLRRIADREQRFRSLLSIGTDGYWELDAELRFVPAELGGAPILGRPSADRCGLRPWETDDKIGVPPECEQRLFDDLRGHRSFRGVRICLQGQSGYLRHLEVAGEPRFGTQGEFLGYWGVVRDLTDEVSTDAELRRSQAMLSMLFDIGPGCVALSEEVTGRCRMVNKRFAQLMGYAESELVGRTAFELGFWHSLREREQLIEALAARGKVEGQRCVFVTKSGERKSMQVAASFCLFEGVRCIAMNARDVTEEERTRLEYAAILQRASIGIAFTRDRKFASVNPRFEQMIGWDTGTLAGQPGVVVWPSEADYAEIGRVAGPLLEQGRSVELERQVRHKNGSLIWCRLLAQALDPNDARNGGTIWIAEDVTEKRQTEKELALARDAAEAANRAKSAFLANTSHEIRTPLHGLLGIARLATQPDLDAARRQRYLSLILDSAQNLAGIITDILDLSKIEAGRIDLEHIEFSLHDTLSAVHQGYVALAEAKGLTMSLAIDPAVPDVVRGDALRLRQILGNFINNALKFTERGHVRIIAKCASGDRVRMAVIDTGPGISRTAQERLFKRFSQADESTTRRFGGTGLGLAICRELAGLMGGEVGVESEVGQGSTFWVELALPVSDTGLVSDDSFARDLEQLRGARVLVAEDNAINMLIVVSQLERWGVEVVQAADGALAVDAVHRGAASGQPIDLVLMDLQMPHVSGFDAARQLREHFDASRLPIIALTAAALVTERDEALQAGMDDFLTKPIDAQRLRRVLARNLARQQGGALHARIRAGG